jgi:hypothetical protein
MITGIDFRMEALLTGIFTQILTFKSAETQGKTMAL